MLATKNENGAYTFVRANEEKSKLKSEDHWDRLCCGHCENLMSKFESYVAPHFKSWKQMTAPRAAGLDIVISREKKCEYRRTKLFWLATVWKCLVASNEYWSKCCASAEVQERMRERVFRALPGKDTDFPVVATLESSGLLKSCLAQPIVAETQINGLSLPVFMVYVAGFRFTMFLGEGLELLDDTPRLRSDNTWEGTPEMINYSKDRFFAPMLEVAEKEFGEEAG